MMRISKLKCDRAYEQRQKEKGIRVRGFRLTDAEWEKVKKFINGIREENKNTEINFEE